MKLVVSAEGDGLDSPVDPRFGRAKYLLLIDTDTGQRAAQLLLEERQLAQGAGIQAAQVAAQWRADAVLTGHVGPKAFATLQAAGIAVYAGVSGTVREAAAQWKAGQLQAVTQATGPGHAVGY